MSVCPENELSAQISRATRAISRGQEYSPERRRVLCVGKRLRTGVWTGTTIIGQGERVDFCATVVTEPSHYGSRPTGVNGLRITYAATRIDQ